MGAVTNMRPDLFEVVLCEVPFVDVMNTMLDATLPLTVGNTKSGAIRTRKQRSTIC
jgi:protease II